MRFVILFICPLMLLAIEPVQTITPNLESNATVRTGKLASRFKVKDHAFLMRPHTKVRFERSKDGNIDVLNVIEGGILSVFGKRKVKLKTHTATMGIRGTALYLEVDEVGTYFCNCYGTIDLYQHHGTEEKFVETIRSTHHIARRIDKNGVKTSVKHGIMYNHTDDELRMLEAMVGRKVPFDDYPFDHHHHH